MNAKRPVRTRADLEDAADSLARAIARLTTRNERMREFLESGTQPVAARVPPVSAATALEDATERARRYWDKLEGRRPSVPPVNHAKDDEKKGGPRKAGPRE